MGIRNDALHSRKPQARGAATRYPGPGPSFEPSHIFLALALASNLALTRALTGYRTRVSEKFRSPHLPTPPGYRTRVSEKFRSASSAVLVASDVAARGVDYPGVSLVVQLGEFEIEEWRSNARVSASSCSYVTLTIERSLKIEGSLATHPYIIPPPVPL
eukprot:scaffold17118_cov89-Isochrysis_galbana.AAC.2